MCVVTVPDLDHQLSEGGAFLGVVGPAAGHEGVEGGGALVWFGQPDALFQLVDHIPVLQPEERLLPTAYYLPQAHRCGRGRGDKGRRESYSPHPQSCHGSS